MKKAVLLYAMVGAGLATLLSCQTPQGSSNASSSGSGSTASSSKTSVALTSHTADEVSQYMNGLKKSSKSNHFYLHYYRYGNVQAEYNDWDVWCWEYRPVAGEGNKYDWVGRSQASDALRNASGSATIDDFGGAYIDIDLKASYDGGWDNVAKKIGGSKVVYTDTTGALDEQIGVQIVQSASRSSSSSFWKNDGGNQFISLKDFALQNNDGTTSYHVFMVQDLVANFSALPAGADASDPFSQDDGKNVTYGNSAYANVNKTDKALQATSPMFLKGTTGGATSGDTSHASLKNGAGVGYQIMVSSFADSDDDGFGDLYGIDQKLDYIASLGVNALWLTPIQSSDSYHGYDISDYLSVDPKFGSAKSPNASAGKATAESALKDYQSLLTHAHEKGMAVVMDLVLNHTSTNNPWFIKSAQLNADYRGYYQWGNNATEASVINEKNFWYPYGDHVYSYYAKFGSSMPELNYSFQSTRDAVALMAKHWCSLGVDGFRMDAVKHIYMDDETSASSGDTIINDITRVNGAISQNYSSNLTQNLNFWKELAYDVKQSYPNAFFVGENFDGHAYHVAPFYEGFDSLFDFYSYYNITSAAAKAHNCSAAGAIQSYDGASAGSAFNLTGEVGQDKGVSSSHGAFAYVDSSKWDLTSVLGVQNRYRNGGNAPSDAAGFSSINGAFTSNHDIARCLNRVAGTGNSDGVQSQGTITSANYDAMIKSATCAEIAELMLPGCTWIYYGDELGMSGNFASGITSAQDGYADLAYRQPMKWKQDGKVGDGSFTTGYAITGSGTGVSWDSVNASSLVPSGEKASTNAHFKAIQDFAKAKSSLPALIRGNYVAYDWGGNSNIFNVVRTLGNEAYNIVVNFSASPIDPGNGFSKRTLVASYNGASLTSIPGFSALLMKI